MRDGKEKGPDDETNVAGPSAEKQQGKQPKRGHGAATRARPTPLFRGNVDPFVAAGLTLIPLHVWNAIDKKGRDRGKSPRDNNWQQRQYDSGRVVESASATGANVGVRLPPDWMVLDVDPRNFPEGRDVLAEFARDFSLDLAACPHTLTGSGGHHYWFRKPADLTTLDSLDGYEGVEFKSRGRQVVAPGSVHPNGRRYEWDDLAPGLAEAPELPAALAHRIRRPERASSGGGAGELAPEQLARTLEQIDPCDFSEHDLWLELMMACHHATDGEGRQEFIEWSTGDPSYQDDAWIIGRRWDSLHSGGSGRVTIATLVERLRERGKYLAPPDPADEFEPYEPEPAEEQPSRWRFLTMEELEALPPPNWLVHGVLVEQSLAAIYGEPESGKSFLAIDVAMSVATGIPWHGRDVIAGGVLYIAAEGAPGLGKRARAWRVERGAGNRPATFHLMRDEINLAGERDGRMREFVQAVTAELGPLRLVVIDTLNQTAAGADENSSKDMGRYIASMKRLRDETGATVAVVHHSGKDPTKGMRGSSSLLGAMDTTIEVVRATDGRSMVVSVRKQKDAEREIPMRFNMERVADSLVLRRTVMAEPEQDFTPSTDPILEMAREMAERGGGQVSLRDLAAELSRRDNISDSSARRRIRFAIPGGRTHDCPLYLEQVDPDNPKAGIVVKIAGRE